MKGGNESKLCYILYLSTVVVRDLGGGYPKVYVEDKVKEIKVLFSHVRINKMIIYSSGNLIHRITVNYNLEFRAQ